MLSTQVKSDVVLVIRSFIKIDLFSSYNRSMISVQKRTTIMVFLTFTVLVLVLGSCSSNETKQVETPYQPLRMFSSDSFYRASEAPKCKFLLDSYCNFLYSPENLGNVEIKQTKASTKVLQGDTFNGFSQVFYRYADAKIKNQMHLPKDFYNALLEDDYFVKLRNYLSRRTRKNMNIAQRLAAEKLEYNISSIWSANLNETIIKRMIKKFPGFHQITDRLMPVELSLENRRVRRHLISQISKALWHNDKNWNRVEEGFHQLQSSYLKMIANLEVSPDLKDMWKQRIIDVRLVLPGSISAISDEECSSTTVNAYYYSYLNLLTVCAGDFNSEDIIQTLSHEMGHALGIDRTQYLFQVNSDFGKNLAKMRKEICQPKSFSCDQWQDYKENFSDLLQSLNGFKPEVPAFQKCLMRRPTSKKLGTSDIHRFTRNIVNDRISSLAASDRFLRITKEKIPTKNGRLQNNPNFLNPCSYSMWSQGEEPIDDELTTLIYFTAEYRCSDKVAKEKMKGAIELSKSMSLQVLEKTLQIEGEFSARNRLEAEGYSSPPFERFADVMGSYAMAEFLKKLPNKLDRQNTFLASNSWQCTEPTLASHFPEESAVEKEYSFDSHTEGDLRRKEILSKPIRDAISCEKDFEFKECSLPFKK